MSTPKLEANVITFGATSNSPSDWYHVFSMELCYVCNTNDWFIDSGLCSCVLIKKCFLYIMNQAHILYTWGMGA